MARWLAVVVMLVGCSFKTGDIGITSVDAPADTTGTEEPQEPGCWPRWHDHSIRFDTPALAGITDVSSIDRDPTLWGNDLTLYFQSIRGAVLSHDLYVATRTSVAAPFTMVGAPMHFDSLQTPASDGKLGITTDGLRVTLSSSRGGGFGQTDIWQAKRATLGDDFGAPTEGGLAMVDDALPQYDPTLTGDGLAMYFAPLLTSHPMQVIVKSTRANLDAEFSTPTIEPGLDSNTGDGDPSPSADETVIVFSSNRGNSDDGVDLYYAVRDHVTDAWGGVTAIPDVNSSSNEGDPMMTSDGCQLLFASDRDRGEFNWTVYAATATPTSGRVEP